MSEEFDFQNFLQQIKRITTKKKFSFRYYDLVSDMNLKLHCKNTSKLNDNSVLVLHENLHFKI